MRKKISVITMCLLLLFISVCLCSCKADGNAPTLDSEEQTSAPTLDSEAQTSAPTEHSESNYSDPDEWAMIHEGENYKVYYNERHFWYYYSIWDENERGMDSGWHDARGGGITITQEGQFITLNDPHGGPLWSERYYDVSNGRVSRFFPNVVARSGELVAFFKYVWDDSGAVLIVQNKYDPEKYYREFPGIFPDTVYRDTPEGEFLDGNTKLKVPYWTEPDYETKTEILILQ